MDMEETVVLLDVEQAYCTVDMFLYKFHRCKIIHFFNKLYLDMLPFAHKFLSFVKISTFSATTSWVLSESKSFFLVS